MPAPKNSPKSMDIQKPGSVKPDSSAKPIIVTNRPILQDPMVKDASTSNEASDIPETTPVADEKLKDPKTAGSTKVIQPLAKEAESPTKTDDATETVEATDTPEQTPQEESPEPKTTDSLPDEADSPASSEAAVVDAVVAGANKSGEQSEAQAAESEDDKRRQAAQVLAESKKYVVPIGQVTKARHNRNSLVLLVVLIGVAAGFFAVYKGLIPLPFKLPIPLPK